MEIDKIDFNWWNFIKKELNFRKKLVCHPKNGEIWYAHLGLNIGFEQNGKGKNFIRPVLILKVYNIGLCLVMPLTSERKSKKYHIPITHNKRLSYGMITQTKIISIKRIVNRRSKTIGNFDEIKKQVKENLL